MAKVGSRKGAKAQSRMHILCAFAPLRAIFALTFICLFFCCTNTQNLHSSAPITYFSLDNYFKIEARRLARKHPLVKKIASKDNHSEQKTLRISNWQNEFSLFLSSDINKPAWKSSYQVTKRQNWLEYRAVESELRTRLIRIRSDENGKIVQISIRNNTHNYLFSSSEELDYFPDSLYSITKNQKVLLIGSSNYYIRGIILK